MKLELNINPSFEIKNEVGYVFYESKDINKCNHLLKRFNDEFENYYKNFEGDKENLHTVVSLWFRETVWSDEKL